MELPGGMGQHFFFDIGNGECLDFFYWAGGTPSVPGAAHPMSAFVPSADGAMYHVAVAIAPDDVESVHERLTSHEVEVTFVAHHLERPSDSSIDDIAEDTYGASFYFADPDGLQIGFCAWLPAWERVINEHTPTEGRVSLVV